MVHISLCLFPPSKCHQKGLPSVASSGEYLLSSRTNERFLVLANTSPIFLPFTCSSTSTINIVLLAHQIITMFSMTLQSGTSDAWTIVLEHLMENVVDWGLFTILQYLVLSTLTSQDISLQHKLSSATETFQLWSGTRVSNLPWTMKIDFRIILNHKSISQGFCFG